MRTFTLAIAAFYWHTRYGARLRRCRGQPPSPACSRARRIAAIVPSPRESQKLSSGGPKCLE